MESIDYDGLSENEVTIREVVTDLALSEAIRTDWSKTLRSAPTAISALGGCAILASLPTAAAVSLDYGDQGSTTLPAKLFECNQKGRTSFMEAQARMQSIRVVSANVGPLLDKIMLLFDEPQTAFVRKNLDVYMHSLERSAKKTTLDTQAALIKFRDWYRFTVDFSNKVVGKQGTLALEESQKTHAIRQKERDQDEAAAKAIQAQDTLERQQAKLNEAIRTRDLMVDTTTAGLGVAAAVAPVGPAIGLSIAVASHAPVVFAEAGVAKALKEEQKRQMEIELAKNERERLMADLRDLQHDGTSLEDARKVLGRAIERLIALQSSIETILLFFEAIQSEVENLVEYHNTPLIEQLDFGRDVSPEEKNELVTAMIRQQALDVKVRFTIMQRLAQVYCKVSEEYILNGFDIIQKLSLFKASMSDDDARISDKTLEDYRKRADEGIQVMTLEYKKMLIDSLQSDVERAARGTIQKKIGPPT